jgi:ABC-type transport system involved in cytochrome c biogenesis permease subunit
MKVEFELNLMGIFYILVAVGLMVGAALLFGLLPGITENVRQGKVYGKNNWESWALFTTFLTIGLIAVGLLVPVVRRIFKAFMP